MKIAEVSVNLEALPSREDLIKLALKTKKYNGKHNALELINKEIDGTKLFQTVKAKRKTSTKPSSKIGDGHSNNKQSKSNKSSKE